LSVSPSPSPSAEASRARGPLRRAWRTPVWAAGLCLVSAILVLGLWLRVGWMPGPPLAEGPGGRLPLVALAQGQIAPGMQAPVDGAAGVAAVWQPVRLPDHWGVAQRQGTWTYRLDLGPCTQALPACWPGDDARALWIPKVGTNLEVWLNGVRVSHHGTLHGRPFDYSIRPLILHVSPGLLRMQGNELRLVVTGMPGHLAGLSRVWWGAYADLLFPYAEQDYFVIGGTVSVITVAAMFTLAGLWSAWRTRRPATWLFTLAGMCWLVREEIQLVGFRIMDLDMALQVAVLAKCMTMLISCLLMLRLMSQRQPLVRALLMAEMACVPLWLAAMVIRPDWGGAHTWLAGWHLLVQGTVLILALGSIGVTWRSPTVSNALIMLGSLGSVAIGLLDAWHFQLSGRHEGFEHLPLTSYMALCFLLSVSASMYLRINTALKLEGEHKEALQREVQAQREELERLHARESERLQREAVVSERSRIIRDMHDGLGSQLVGLLSAVQAGQFTQAELASEVQEAIDQLRLTIDTLEPLGNDLSSLLGQLRFRLESRLRKIGFQVEWDVDELPGGEHLGPQGLSSLQRLLYEVFSNIMKHSRARRVSVRGRHDPAQGFNEIVICDDGQGHDMQVDTGGRGLRHMRDRAAQLKAGIVIESRPGEGTKVVLRLPCDGSDRARMSM
jgi:signal transduction histidine kinase